MARSGAILVLESCEQTIDGHFANKIWHSLPNYHYSCWYLTRNCNLWKNFLRSMKTSHKS